MNFNLEDVTDESTSSHKNTIQTNMEDKSLTDDACLKKEEVNEELNTNKYSSKKRKPNFENRKRPNCFLSIPITNLETLEKLSGLLNLIVELEPEMQKIVIPLEKIHLTLGVFSIESEEQVDLAKRAMKESLVLMRESEVCLPVRMSVSGLGSFPSGVLFVRVAGSEARGGDDRKDGVGNNKSGGDGGKAGVEGDGEADGQFDSEGDGEVRGDVEGGGNSKVCKEESCIANEKGLKSYDKCGNKKIKMDNVDEAKNVNCGSGVLNCDDSNEALKSIRRITNILLDKFKEIDLVDTNNDKPFNPHITLAKSSKAKFYLKKKFKAMIKKVLDQLTDKDFGFEMVEKIDLCWMSKMDESRKKYQIINSIIL